MLQIIISEEDYTLLQEVKKHGFYLKNLESELYTNSSKPLEVMKALKESGIPKIIDRYTKAEFQYRQALNKAVEALAGTRVGKLESQLESVSIELSKEKSLNKLLENKIENLKHRIEIHKKPWYKRLFGIN